MKRNMSKLTYTHHSLLTPTHTQSEDEIMDLKGNLLLPSAKPTAAASTLAEQEAVHCTTLTENVGNIKIYNVSQRL